jgi:hypothetical protein
MVTSELDGWSPLHVEYRTRLIGLLAQIFFPGLYATKDRDETQALTKGLSKEKTRERIASQRPQTSLLNQGPGHKMTVYG